MCVWMVETHIPIKMKWEKSTHTHSHAPINNQKIKIVFEHEPLEWRGGTTVKKNEWKNGHRENLCEREWKKRLAGQMGLDGWKWIFRVKCEWAHGRVKMCLSLNKGPIKYEPNWNNIFPATDIIITHLLIICVWTVMSGWRWHNPPKWNKHV